ncbi:hypothetical protein DFH09DRAFT_1081512 [Mycena vulgaris]|nr:hypothetical protein DFH09DRAFT_1081512 [Mycena vulgaris]
MFSKIFLLGLSSVLIVDAIPTQTPCSGCAAGKASGNIPLKTPGLYQIRQPVDQYNDKYLQISWSDEGPVQLLKPSGHEQYLPMWWVRKAGEDQFTLEPYGAAGIHAAAAPTSNLVIGSHKSGGVSAWAIEGSGNELWTIKVPAKNTVWESHANGSISLEAADGSRAEHWELNYYGGP